MLCFRCEHRVQFLENKSRPRHECGEIELSKYSCYMYKPVKPIVTKPDEGDNRPYPGSPIFGARGCFVKEADVKLDIEDVEEGCIFYWRP